MPTDSRELITARIDAGWDLAALERDLEQRAPWLEQEERDALWLLAWSLEARRSDRLAGIAA